jgi:signal transduction histidine kinase
MVYEPSHGGRGADISPLHEETSAWKRWIAGIAVVSAVVILQSAAAGLMAPDPRGLRFRLAAAILGTPLVMLPLLWTFRRAACRRLGSTRTLVTGLAVAAVVGAILGATACLLIKRIIGHDLLSEPRRYAACTGTGAVYGLVMCALWVLVFVYPFTADKARLRALEADKLRLEADKLQSAAELARLRAQLEPHFLLNTLNAIAGLMSQDPREARRLLGCLGDLLRDALRDAGEMQTLGEEIAWLRRYAAILEARHAGALSFRWEIGGEASAVLLPRLLLQPLVENAVQHGALRRSGGGQVVVRAAITPPSDAAAARLVCTIADNGPGIAGSPPRSGAFGLHAVRRRLELKCADARLRLESSPGGTRVIVELPCVRAPEPGAALLQEAE